MNKRSLGVLAVILIVLMAIVAFAGLDSLPRSVRNSIATAATHVQTDRSAFNQARSAVNASLAKEPDLFRSQTALWQTRLASDDDKLKQAESQVKELRELEKANRKQDTDKAEEELRRLESLRSGVVGDAAALRAEADRWINYKSNLPQMLAEMRSKYDALHAFDIESQAPAAKKAMLDWPAKKDDLQSRLIMLAGLKKQGEDAWESTAQARAKVEAKADSGIDYGALFAAASSIDSDLRELQRGVQNANTMAAQLYVSRDKLLLDLDDGQPDRQKVRVVETKYGDSTLNGGQTTTRKNGRASIPRGFAFCRRTSEWWWSASLPGSMTLKRNGIYSLRQSPILHLRVRRTSTARGKTGCGAGCPNT